MLPCVVVLWRTQSTSYPQLSLVTVSGLCGRTGSDRMDCCVIDFNLESAACCFFPPFFSKPGPCWTPAAAYLRGIPLIALLQKTHLSKVAGSGVKEGGWNTFSFDPYSTSIFPCSLLYPKRVRFLTSPPSSSHSHLAIMSMSTQVSISQPPVPPYPALYPTCLGGQLLKCCIVGSCRYTAPNI